MTFPYLSSYLSGAGLGASLIIAIGAQNAYVLRQGLKQRHVGLVVSICAAIDVLLIALGIGGMGALIARAPFLLDVIRWAGAIFVFLYGARAFLAAWRGPGHLDAASIDGTRAFSAQSARLSRYRGAARRHRRALRLAAQRVVRGGCDVRVDRLVHDARLRRAALAAVVRKGCRVARAGCDRRLRDVVDRGGAPVVALSPHFQRGEKKASLGTPFFLAMRRTFSRATRRRIPRR
jgi:hypothetical protein